MKYLSRGFSPQLKGPGATQVSDGSKVGYPGRRAAHFASSAWARPVAWLPHTLPCLGSWFGVPPQDSGSLDR